MWDFIVDPVQPITENEVAAEEARRNSPATSRIFDDLGTRPRKNERLPRDAIGGSRFNEHAVPRSRETSAVLAAREGAAG